ncbi:MAG: hypothetical protein ACE5GX_20230 [Thermoanaerobaculia bacterium]
MKNIVNLVIVILVLGAGYFVWAKVLPKDPFALDDSYKVSIESSASNLSDQMRISNNSEIDLRLHMYNASDPIKAIARENWVLKKGASRTYPRDSYVFYVWKSQFFDAGIKWTQTLWTDVEFSGNENNLVVKGGPKPPVTFTNTVDEQLKICIYNAGDTLQVIPRVPCWTISKGRTVKWEDAPELFLLKVFKPAFLDDPLVTESDVPHMSAITISK